MKPLSPLPPVRHRPSAPAANTVVERKSETNLAREQKAVATLIARIRRSPAVAVGTKERHRQLFRGLTGEVSQFDPLAREYHPDERDLYATSDLQMAGSYACGDPMKPAVGYIIELLVPVSMLDPHQACVLRLNAARQDLSPYVRRIGVITDGVPKADLLVYGRSSLGLIEQRLREIETFGVTRFAKRGPAPRRSAASLTPEEIASVNYYWNRGRRERAIGQGDPAVIRWYAVPRARPRTAD